MKKMGHSPQPTRPPSSHRLETSLPTSVKSNIHNLVSKVDLRISNALKPNSHRSRHVTVRFDPFSNLKEKTENSEPTSRVLKRSGKKLKSKTNKTKNKKDKGQSTKRTNRG